MWADAPAADKGPTRSSTASPPPPLLAQLQQQGEQGVLQKGSGRRRRLLLLPITLPLHLSSDEVVGGRGNVLTELLQVFQEDSMRIFQAVLTGKRVLFVGYNHAAADVCRLVLTTASLISPPFTGVIRRVFPYSNLSDLDFLQV